MKSGNQKDALTIRQIEYTIRMKDKDNGFHELREILHAELTRFEDTRHKNDTGDNPIRQFLKTNIERSIIIKDNTRVYFMDYTEKEGSFVIQFNLLVITRYLNYSSIRQAIDYLIKDTIGDYFEELLERHIPATVTVNSNDEELYEVPFAETSEIEPAKNKANYFGLFPVILSAVALLATIILLLFVLLRHPAKPAYRESINENYQDKYYELLIEKKINEALEKNKVAEQKSPCDSLSRVIQKAQ